MKFIMQSSPASPYLLPLKSGIFLSKMFSNIYFP